MVEISKLPLSKSMVLLFKDNVSYIAGGLLVVFGGGLLYWAQTILPDGGQIRSDADQPVSAGNSAVVAATDPATRSDGHVGEEVVLSNATIDALLNQSDAAATDAAADPPPVLQGTDTRADTAFRQTAPPARIADVTATPSSRGRPDPVARSAKSPPDAGTRLAAPQLRLASDKKGTVPAQSPGPGAAKTLPRNGLVSHGHGLAVASGGIRGLYRGDLIMRRCGNSSAERREALLVLLQQARDSGYPVCVDVVRNNEIVERVSVRVDPDARL